MLVAIAFLAVGETQLQSSQPTGSFVAIFADAQGLAFVPAPDRQPCGTYWDVRNGLPCLGAPLPCPPSDPDTPVYATGGVNQHPGGWFNRERYQLRPNRN